MTRQTWTAAVAALVFVALAAIIAMVPVPFVVWTPGATYDLLGEVADQPAISITGADTYPTDGQLRMATVSVTRSDAALTLPEALFSYWLPNRQVLPREAVYRPGLDSAQIQDDSARQMGSSQSLAAVAALRAAGVRVVERPMVESVYKTGPAAGLLEPGDLITAVDNTRTSTVEQVREAIRKHKIGDVVKFDLIRGDVPLAQSVTTKPSEQEPDVPVVGITMSIGFTYAPEITFGIDAGIGGSSAGLMFALAIYDQLTPGSLSNGAVVAGTGTIDTTGRVSAIGGVQEKIAAAARDGATVFLLPTGNCADVGEVPDGMRLLPVENLGDALSGLQDLQDPARAEALRGCS